MQKRSVARQNLDPKKNRKEVFAGQRRPVTYMAQAQLKITQISKDFNLKSKEVTDAFKDVGIDKKSGAAADGDEFELFMEHLMVSHQIKDLESYLVGKNKITAVKEKREDSAPKNEAPLKVETPVKETVAPAAEVKKPEAKPEVKKAPMVAKPQQPAERRPEQTRPADRRPAQPGERRDFNQGQRQGDRRDFNQGQRQGDRPQYQR